MDDVYWPPLHDLFVVNKRSFDLHLSSKEYMSVAKGVARVFPCGNPSQPNTTRRAIGSSTDVSRPAILTGGSNASSTDVPQPAGLQNTLQTFRPNSRLNDPISARRRSCVSEWILLNWTKQIVRRRVAARGRKMVARTNLTLRWNIGRGAKQVTRIHWLILILHLFLPLFIYRRYRMPAY
jgi:hypothetical protein